VYDNAKEKVFLNRAICFVFTTVSIR